MAIGKTKAFSTYDMERILNRNGFICVRHNSDHQIWKRINMDGKKETVVLNRNMNKMVSRRIIKENNLVF